MYRSMMAQNGSADSIDSLLQFLNAAATNPYQYSDDQNEAGTAGVVSEPGSMSSPSNSDSEDIDSESEHEEFEKDLPENIRGASMLASRDGGLDRWALGILDSQVRDAARANASDIDEDEGEDPSDHRATSKADNPNAKALERVGGEDLAIHERRGDADVDSAERLQRIEREFGVWPGGGEEWLEHMPAALWRSVLIKGTIALTNKRIVYLAYIPKASSKVIHAGGVTLHPKGRFTRKFRRWVELRSDTMTAYKSSTTLYKPVWACSLTDLKSVSPLRGNRFQMTLNDSRTVEVEYDTEESAFTWHDEIHSALFRFRTSGSDRLRISLPLRRIKHFSSFSHQAIAKMMDFELDMVTGVSEPDDDPQRSLTFSYLLSHDPFDDRLREQIKIAQAEHQDCPTCDLPEAILEIGGRTAAEKKAKVEAGKEDEEKDLDGESDLEQEDLDMPEVKRRFAKTFALHTDPSELFVMRCALVRSLPTLGTICISKESFCFWRKLYLSEDVRLRVPLKDIEEVSPTRAFGFHVWGVAIQVTGYPDIRLDFGLKADRNEVISVLRAARDKAHVLAERKEQCEKKEEEVYEKKLPLGQMIHETVKLPEGMYAKVMNVNMTVMKRDPKHFVLLTIGSRGDVQPYISLGRRLQKDGNTVTIASHPEYRKWCESFGLGYREVGGDPAALMKLSIEHPILSPGFFKESIGHFRQWLDNLFEESWIACQDADVLVESPSTFAGIHVSEALKIPYFRAFTMPWTSTAAYPQAFAAGIDLGSQYNLMSYSLFDNVIWQAMSGQVNRWRKRTLKLPSTTMERLLPNKTPFCYNFSPAVVPRPNDWKDHIGISGYWFLDQSQADFTPSDSLLKFIKKAKDDKVPLAYIGFGSITVGDAAKVTRDIYAAVRGAGVRGIVVKGWSERGSSKPHEDIPTPEDVFTLDSIPHDWLFPQIDAAFHHGGAGTTGASLRFGLPTLIHPFFGDQGFWAQRVQKLGAGLKVDSLGVNDMTSALKKATTDRIMKEKAARVGDKIRTEDGPSNAVDFLYKYMSLAQKRVDERVARSEKKLASQNKSPRTSTFMSTASTVPSSALSTGTAPTSLNPTRSSTVLSSTLTATPTSSIPSTPLALSRTCSLTSCQGTTFCKKLHRKHKTEVATESDPRHVDIRHSSLPNAPGPDDVLDANASDNGGSDDGKPVIRKAKRTSTIGVIANKLSSLTNYVPVALPSPIRGIAAMPIDSISWVVRWAASKWRRSA